MNVKTLIIDDEILARSRIKSLLADTPDFYIVGESKNGNEALEDIASKQPDLIFLDVKMPGLNGFDVIEKLNLNYTPFIIFVTAFEEFALKAFDVSAVDYLLKPFDDERFYEALNKAKSQIKLLKANALNNKFRSLLKDEEDSEYRQSFTLKEKGLNKVIDVNTILFIEAEGNYLKLVTESSYFLYRCTMNKIEDQLDPDQFLRIHRSYIVNTHYLKSANYLYENNEYEFVLRNKQRIHSGRSYKQKINDYLTSGSYHFA